MESKIILTHTPWPLQPTMVKMTTFSAENVLHYMQCYNAAISLFIKICKATMKKKKIRWQADCRFYYFKSLCIVCCNNFLIEGRAILNFNGL